MQGSAHISLAIMIIAVLVLGSAGAYLGHRLPIPAGVLVCTLLGVGVATSGGALLGLPEVPLPPGTMPVTQVALGMLVGFRMDRHEILSGARALVPALLLVAVIVPASVAVALAVVPLTSLDLVTALFAAAPGGLTEMSVVSLSFGADGAAVATVQLLRVLLGIGVTNLLLKRYTSKDEHASKEQGEQDEGEQDAGGYVEGLKRLGVAAPWGILGGVAGVVSQAPAGGIFGALIGSAAFVLITGRPVPLKGFQVGVQVLGGAVIGLDISSGFFVEIFQHAGAGAIILSVQMVLWLVTGWLLFKLSSYDLITSALASTPGGISSVIQMADEAGADTVVVTFIHLVRLVSVVVAVPLLVVLVFNGG